MFRFDQQTFKYGRYIVVLTKRAANENLKVMQMKTSYLHFTVSCFVPVGLNAISATFFLEMLYALKQSGRQERRQKALFTQRQINYPEMHSSTRNHRE